MSCWALRWVASLPADSARSSSQPAPRPSAPEWASGELVLCSLVSGSHGRGPRLAGAGAGEWGVLQRSFGRGVPADARGLGVTFFFSWRR